MYSDLLSRRVLRSTHFALCSHLSTRGVPSSLAVELLQCLDRHAQTTPSHALPCCGCASHRQLRVCTLHQKEQERIFDVGRNQRFDSRAIRCAAQAGRHVCWCLPPIAIATPGHARMRGLRARPCDYEGEHAAELSIGCGNGSLRARLDGWNKCRRDRAAA